MPRATVSSSDTERFELSSLPEGYVVLRRMTYDQLLERRDLAMKLSVRDSGSGNGSGRATDVEAVVASANKAVASFEFGVCIVEHNLTDEADAPLVFPRDLGRLDPRVGEEIGTLIDKMNNFEPALKN